VVSRRQVEFLRPRLLHQPANERFNLLRWHRTGTKYERVTFLSLVLLWVNVKLLAIHYSRTLDSLPRGAINATEDHIDLILLDELSSFGFCCTIYSCTVLKVQVYLSKWAECEARNLRNSHLACACLNFLVGRPGDREWRPRRLTVAYQGRNFFSNTTTLSPLRVVISLAMARPFHLPRQWPHPRV